jgi:hypothetical protein
MKKAEKYILFLLLLIPFSGRSQFGFNRTIEKHPSSDTITLRYQLRQCKAGEICRIQQKIPTSFKLICQEQKADTSYFDKDIATSIWSSMPNDSIIEYTIKLKAPEKSQGYIYVGDCACMYGGKNLIPTRKYFPKERVYLTDSTLVPYQDTVLFSQIDSINKLSAVKKQPSKKNHRKVVVKKDAYVFRIQITATKIKQDLKDLRRDLVAPDQLFEEVEKDLYKYTIGNFKTYKQAKERLAFYQLRKTKGYIVAYKNGVRVGVKEAKAEEEPELIEQ